MLGDLGGIVEVLMVLFVFIITPVSDHSFWLAASNKLFWAKTRDKNFFRDKHARTVKKEAMKFSRASSRRIPNKVIKELDYHRDIHLYKSDSIKLCLANFFSRCYCTCIDKCCFRKRKKL